MKKKIIVILVCIILLKPLKVNATRDCCSHHGGVSGCSSSGRLVCNDGTLSPGCTCTPTVTYTYGCTDKNASNYNSSANRDDGSCIYYTYGCTDEAAKNYNSSANKDDGTCEYYVLGCKNPSADNYDPKAEIDDGSCIISTSKNIEDNDSEDEKDNNSLINTILGIGVISGGVYLYKRKHK